MTLPTDQQEQSVPFCQLKRETPHKRNETDRRSQPGLGINQLTCNAFARNPTTSFNHGLTTAKHHSGIIYILYPIARTRSLTQFLLLGVSSSA